MGALAQKQNDSVNINIFEKKKPRKKNEHLKQLFKRILNFVPRSPDLNFERFSELEAKRSLYNQRRGQS